MNTEISAANLKYTIMSSPIKTNRYVVTVCFEHGDGDIMEHDDIELQNFSEQQFVDWCNRFYEFSDLFDRDNNIEDFEEEYVDRLTIHGVDIPYVEDKCGHGHSETYTKMYIEEVIYYGPDGDQWAIAIIK